MIRYDSPSVLLFCVVDVNECTDPDLCAYGTCHNTNGSYACRCDDGTVRAHCYRGNSILSIASARALNDLFW